MSEILARLWSGRWLILAAMLLGLLAAGLWLKILTAPQYAATMVIAPAGDQGTEQLTKQMASSAGEALLSVTGFPLGSSEIVTSFDRFIAHLTSVPLAQRLEAKYGALRRVFGTDWNATAGRWEHDPGLAGGIANGIRKFFGQPGWSPPTATTLAEFLKRRLVVYPIARTGLRGLQIRMTDGVLAAQLLEWVYTESDRLIREEAADRIGAELHYLRARLDEATVAQYRETLIERIAEREQALMTIELDLPFVAQRIEGPTVSERPVSPRPVQTLIVGIIIGLFLALFAVLVITDPRNWRRPYNGRGSD